MITAVGNDASATPATCARSRPWRAPATARLFHSGTDNLLAAFAKARAMGVSTTDRRHERGGALAASPDLSPLPRGESDSHRVQECHVAIYHILWDLVHTLLADPRADGSSA
jgi:D-sedoheptulose 7-phosphate isomerase